MSPCSRTCVWLSIRPGRQVKPDRSISCAPAAAARPAPTALMRSPSTRIAAPDVASRPVPSISRPQRISVDGAGVGAAASCASAPGPSANAASSVNGRRRSKPMRSPPRVRLPTADGARKPAGRKGLTEHAAGGEWASAQRPSLEAPMGQSEFDEAYEDDPGGVEREEQELGERILNAPIRALDPRPAITVPASAPVRDAIRAMLDREVGAVLVERAGRVVGIFTERDVLRRVVEPQLDQGRPVADVMTPDPETLQLDDGIAFALNRMILRGFRHVPVLDPDGSPAAVVSQREVVAYIVSLLPRRVLNLPPDPTLEARSPDGG